MASPKSWRRNLKLERPEVVFSAKIDYDHERRKSGSQLRPSQSSNDGEMSEVEREV